MASRIITKKGSGAPLASDLVHGELAVDTVNKRLYTENAGGTVIEVGTSPSTIDINAGTIDGTVIGGSTPAAGTFTTFTSTGIDDNATSTAITIDASENVGIGTSLPYTALDVSGGTTNQVGIFRSTDATATVGFADNTTPLTGNLSYVTLGAVGNNMVFNTNLAEAMRIDSSGALLVGKTANDNTTAGFKVQSGGFFSAVADGTTTCVLNRLTSDGDIAIFRKDGTTVGSIGARGDDVYLETGDTGIRMFDASDAIIPVGSTGVSRDGAINLGVSNIRFKDLYLSGGVYLGGTGAANHLDDYEEGTFTPVVEGGTTAGTGTYTIQSGSYTKTGNRVNFTIVLGWTAHTGTGALRVVGLPFNTTNVSSNREAFSLVAENLTYSGTSAVCLTQTSGNDELVFLNQSQGTGLSAISIDTAVPYLVITGQYRTS